MAHHVKDLVSGAIIFLVSYRINIINKHNVSRVNKQFLPYLMKNNVSQQPGTYVISIINYNSSLVSCYLTPNIYNLVSSVQTVMAKRTCFLWCQKMLFYRSKLQYLNRAFTGVFLYLPLKSYVLSLVLQATCCNKNLLYHNLTTTTLHTKAAFTLCRKPCYITSRTCYIT